MYYSNTKFRNLSVLKLIYPIFTTNSTPKIIKGVSMANVHDCDIAVCLNSSCSMKFAFVKMLQYFEISFY